jgi:hypothetical protein
LAVIRFVLATFLAASLTDIGTDFTDFVHEPRAAAHERGGRPANLGAVLVEPNALGHLFHVPLAEARVGTVFTFLGTAYAGFDTRLVFLVSHHRTPPDQGRNKFSVKVRHFAQKSATNVPPRRIRASRRPDIADVREVR